MCRKCVESLSTISPMMKDHLKEKFIEAMHDDLASLDIDVPFLFAYEVHAEALKSTVDEVLMDDITTMMISAMTGDMDGLAAMLGESSDFQKEWA